MYISSIKAAIEELQKVLTQAEEDRRALIPQRPGPGKEKEAKDVAIMWAIEASDLTVKICGNLLKVNGQLVKLAQLEFGLKTLGHDHPLSVFPPAAEVE